MELSRTELSVVVPVYNSSATLRTFVEVLDEAVRGRVAALELILVNDGSSDDSWRVVEDLEREHEWVRGIDLMRNYGQHNALLCGIRAARYPVVATMDDDLQHPPSELPRLLDALTEDVDVVYGVPEVVRHGPGRRLGSWLLRAALRTILPRSAADGASAFRVFRTELRTAAEGFQSDSVSIDVMLGWATTRFALVRVRHDPRRVGTSGYGFGKLVRHAFDMITGFSTLPLRIASMLGLVFTGVGILLLAFVVGRYLVQGTSVPGFAFTASSITLFSGVQLFCLGIIGEYIARIHRRSMGRPAYAVRVRTNDEDDE